MSFLLTDVQGSTRLWERFPESMAQALALHDRVVAEVVAAAGGVLVKWRGEGDSTFSVFADPVAAIDAAVAFQRALQVVAWPEGVALSVRAAVHTGVAEQRDGDYFGSVVNRAARLRAAGHGGQTLLSGATADKVGSALPAGVSLRDLGARRLKDLTEPEHIFEVQAPDLPRGFPPLQTLDDRRHNLPAQPTAFLGRTDELAEVLGLLRQRRARLVTLIGPGGTGKTRIALQVGAEGVDDFEGGVCFVALAGLSDPGLIEVEVGSALGVQDAPGATRRETIAAFLKDRQTLLVLDNLEHLIEGVDVVAEWLAAAPGLSVVATSRVGLRLRAEHVVVVPSLAAATARELFLERAAAAGARLAANDTTEAVVREICERLDNLPLAIELVAARLGEMTIEEVRGGLERALDLAARGPRDAPFRHQALADTIAWSYDLLGGPQQTLFRTLSTFRGGWTLAAAKQVCPAAEHEVEPLLATLVHSSLVVERDDRFSMLETVRAFAGEKLTEAEETDWAVRSHLAWILDVLGRLANQMRRPGYEGMLDATVAELDNLRAAHDTAVRLGLTESALALAGPSSYLWHHSYREGLARIEQSLSLDGAAESPSFVLAMIRAAGLEVGLGHYEAAAARAPVALAIAQRLGDPNLLALAHTTAAMIAWPTRDWDAYGYHNQHALDFAMETGDIRLAMIVRSNQAMMLRMTGHVRHLDTCRAILSEAGDLGMTSAIFVGDYAEALAYAGRFEEAITTATEAVAQALAADDRATTMLALGVKAHAETMLGRLDDALATGSEVLEVVRREPIQEGEIYFRRLIFVKWLSGDDKQARALHREYLGSPYAGRPAWADDAEFVALAAAQRHCPDIAAELLGVAAALRDAEHTTPFPFQQGVVDHALQLVRDALGAEPTEAGIASGRDQDIDTILTRLYEKPAPAKARVWQGFPGTPEPRPVPDSVGISSQPSSHHEFRV